ncbi:glutathione S-transferase family protein [Oxalobacteraceae bacterium OM1]|nr:glutathione S-transferase family protein [Oxalobacteraceae bacterium OM1]
MADIILHHYANSPFSEKIRLIFGYKQIAWKSVVIPAIMPKPNLTALTGGYRRTPVLQIGSDIYCDTALIADVLERVTPTPTLYPKQSEGAARILAQWADATLFWTVIAYVFQPAGMQGVLGGMTPEQMKAFAADRAAFRSTQPRMSVQEASGYLPLYLQRLENMLEGGQPYLFGADASIADFAVYHCLWFLQLAPALTGILEPTPRLREWSDRMKRFGHHHSEEMRAETALEIARSHASGPLDIPFVNTHGASLGDRVSIMPTDYGLDPVEGELVLSTANEFVVRRTDPLAGTVTVHFPRLGFQLKKI